MTLIVPTAYRRNLIRERNQAIILQAKVAGVPVQGVKCLRCFNDATVEQRCDSCRAARTSGNAGRKR